MDGQGVVVGKQETKKATSETGRRRPALFRALGKQDPPPQVQWNGKVYTHVETLKHDSWAATAIYARGHEKLVCKFNRQQSILGFPMKWLGRWLAQRECGFLDRLAQVPGVPPRCDHIAVDGQELPNLSAHVYIEGRPLEERDNVNDEFFPRLFALLDELHQRDMAYMDAHKRENILVGDDGNPYLIDFQISCRLPNRWPTRAILKTFQKSDLYHFRKHVAQNRRDWETREDYEKALGRPWWIRAHRRVAKPIRSMRRKFLVMIGVRKERGMAETECDAEDAVRRRLQQAA